MDMRFCRYVPKSLRNKNTERHIPHLLKKMVFWPSKLCYLTWACTKKTFSSTLNIMILLSVRNKCVRFGRHVDIEVSYKILWLEALKEAPILLNSPCFQ
jgi:hypothetical protein